MADAHTKPPHSLFSKISVMDLLLAFVPAAIIADFLVGSGTLVFVLAGLGVIPLAGKMSQATEALARHWGPSWGGLLNATFGNAAELIIAFFAVKAGLLDVVKASISGSILGNLLLVLGASLLLGGWKNGSQRFNGQAVGLQSAMLLVAVGALLIPDTFVRASVGMARHPEHVQTLAVQHLSVGVALILIIVYICGTYYSMVHHSPVFGSSEGAAEEPVAGITRSLALLAASTVFVAWLSELLVGSIEGVVHGIGLSEMFIGLVVVPIVGNAAEHASAVVLALKNKVDISFAIAIGSSTQIALFVAPVLILVSLLVGHPLTIIFLGIEIWSLMVAVLVVTVIAHDGRSNWLEGLMLVASYAILAMAAYFVKLPG